jgi:hypothetical protein
LCYQSNVYNSIKITNATPAIATMIKFSKACILHYLFFDPYQISVAGESGKILMNKNQFRMNQE